MESLKTAARMESKRNQRERESLGVDEDIELVVQAVSGGIDFHIEEQVRRDCSGDEEIFFTFRV